MLEKRGEDGLEVVREEGWNWRMKERRRERERGGRGKEEGDRTDDV